MKIENNDDIYKWNIEQLYNALQVIIQEENLTPEEQAKIQKIQDGIDIDVNIHYIIKKYYEDLPSAKKTHVSGHGKHELKTFHEDIKKREALIREIILNNQEEEVLEPR